MRGCLVRLIFILFVVTLQALIRAIWYIILIYVYALVCLVVGLPTAVRNITENLVWKAATEWRLDFRLQEALRKITPFVAYVCIVACWIFTAASTTALLYFLLKPLVWR